MSTVSNVSVMCRSHDDVVRLSRRMLRCTPMGSAVTAHTTQTPIVTPSCRGIPASIVALRPISTPREQKRQHPRELGSPDRRVPGALPRPVGQRQHCRRQDGDLDPHPLRSQSRRWLPLALRRPVDTSALRCRASVLCAHFLPGSGLPLVCTPSRPWRTCRSGLPAGKNQQLSDPFGGSLRYFGLSVMGSPWGPETWCAHFPST